MKIIYRQGNLFKIDESILSPKNRTSQIINGLYAAVYEEFRGASVNPKYKNFTPLEKLNKLNEFAENWLRTKGLL